MNAHLPGCLLCSLSSSILHGAPFRIAPTTPNLIDSPTPKPEWPDWDGSLRDEDYPRVVSESSTVSSKSPLPALYLDENEKAVLQDPNPRPLKRLKSLRIDPLLRDNRHTLVHRNEVAPAPRADTPEPSPPPSGPQEPKLSSPLPSSPPKEPREPKLRKLSWKSRVGKFFKSLHKRVFSSSASEPYKHAGSPEK